MKSLAKRRQMAEARSIQDQSYVSALTQKWQPLLKGIRNEHTKNVMAVLYENQSQYLMGLNEDTMSTNVGSFLKFVFPVLRRVFPSLIANEIVSVQPMTAPIGGIFYYELKYGTTKGSVTAGDNLIKNFNAYYSSEEIDVEAVGTGNGSLTTFAHTLAYTPVQASTVTITAGSVVATDDGAGNLTGTGVSAGTVNYATGAVSITYSAAPANATAITATYHYNMEENSNLPQVNIDIELLEIKAKSRKLKALWSSEAADDLKAFHGLDAEAELVAGIAAEIALELDREIIDDLRLGQPGYSGTFNISSVPSGNSQIDWIRSMITEITKGANRIHKNSLRGPANFMVTSPDVSAYFEQLTTHGDFRPAVAPPEADPYTPVQQPHTFGVYHVGTVSAKYALYKDPFFPTVNVGTGSGTGNILLGYKGQTFLDAGYVWAPYIPLQVTATFLDPNDFQFRKGLRTRYATSLVRSEFYGQVQVQGM